MLYAWRTAVQAISHINWEGNLALCEWVCFLKELKWNLWEMHFPPWKAASCSWHATVPLQHLLEAAGQAKSQTFTYRSSWVVGTWHSIQSWGPKFPSKCQSCWLNHTCSNKHFFVVCFYPITITKLLELESSWQHCCVAGGME